MRGELPSPERPHGPHTLRVFEGRVVGCFGDDVFVELGPRMQGVISARAFDEPPGEGELHHFTLRGKEESLWALALAEERSLASWEDMEPGQVVPARVMREVPGGLQLKIGALHAFLPRSQTGLPRGKKVDPLIGKNLTVEVIEVDPERQRVIVSRRPVLTREREGKNHNGKVQTGQVVSGRVVRIEAFGAFVSFGHGLEGLVHVSNLAHERVEHPADLVELGQSISVKVLHVRRGGKRIGLGLKQMVESPWRALERESYEGQIVEGTVTRIAEFGALVQLRPGVEGLLHNSETGRDRARGHLRAGQRMSVRIVEMEIEDERMTLSLLHSDGSRITADEARAAAEFEELRTESEAHGSGTPLGPLLRRALGGGDAATGVGA